MLWRLFFYVLLFGFLFEWRRAWYEVASERVVRRYLLILVWCHAWNSRAIWYIVNRVHPRTTYVWPAVKLFCGSRSSICHLRSLAQHTKMYSLCSMIMGDCIKSV